MKPTLIAWVLSLTLGLAGWLPTAKADTTEATCDVIGDGDAKKDAPGTCTFSQREGTIRIRVHDGETFALSPGGLPDHFHDQYGNHVTRSASGDRHEYAWKHKKIVVTFGRTCAEVAARQ
jgi:hypothetical protein